MNEYELNIIGLGGKPVSGFLDTAEEIRALYQRLVNATEEEFMEFDRARRASELEARFYSLD